MGCSNCESRTACHTAIAFVVGLTIFFFVMAIKSVGKKEITTQEYGKVHRLAEEYPEILPVVQKALEDDKIILSEYHEINREKEQAVKTRAINTLKTSTETESVTPVENKEW